MLGVKSVPSTSYAIINGTHAMLEHVNHHVHPSKTALDFLQDIHNLEIPTPNYAVAAQSFDSCLPKYFCESKDHKAVKPNNSMFDKVKSFTDLDGTNYGHRKRLNE